MWTRWIRKSLEREEGQALVLACLLLLILSLGVLTTVNLGHTLNERIRLQNNADAAAYSMAALEARAFNFYAYANRAQASHYVSAMVWQSTLSFATFSEAFLVDALGIFRTVADCKGLRRIACETVRPFFPGVIETLQAIDTGLQSIARIARGILAVADRTIGRIAIPSHRTLNEALAGASTAVMLSTLEAVKAQASAVILANDPDVDPLSNLLATSQANQCLFDRAHMRVANGSPLQPNTAPTLELDPRAKADDDKTARAKRAMAGVANATRFGCDVEDGTTGNCPDAFVTNRSAVPAIPGLGALPTLLFGRESADWRERRKWGQTRLLTHGLARGFLPRNASAEEVRGGHNFIRFFENTPDAQAGMMAQGDNLGADDPYRFLGAGFFEHACPNSDDRTRAEDEVPYCWGETVMDRASRSDLNPLRQALKTSVWALNDHETGPKGEKHGLHFRVSYPGDSGAHGASGLNERRYLLLFAAYFANVRGVWDGNHRWRGMVPFPHFEPGQFAQECQPDEPHVTMEQAATRESEFNQPSAWVMLSKTGRQMRNPNGASAGAGTNAPAVLTEEGRLNLELLGAQETLELEDERESLGSGFSSGIHALSRAQTYYHRPGNWTEMPNFFNPYWRARLASVYQGRQSLPIVQELIDQFPDELKRSPQKVITH